MRAIIVDDEKASREILFDIIENYCNGVEVVAEADSIKDAYECINKNKPDLVFLDVEMPHGNAFELLKKFDSIPFKIIFTTAYKQYTLEAIKVEAVDYLLKPLSIKEVIAAVEKVKKKNSKEFNKEAFNEFLQEAERSQYQNPYLAIPVSNGYEMIAKSDIIRCEAFASYTGVFVKNKGKRIISKKLGELENILPSNDFFRIHHSHIVNRNHITQYIRGEGGTVLTDDEQEIPVSRRKKSDFMQWLILNDKLGHL